MHTESTPKLSSFEPEADGSRELFQAVLNAAAVARRRQTTILWSLAATTAIGALCYVSAPRYFRSDAKLMIVERRGDEVSGVSDQAGADNVMTTHKELVRSPVVITEAIDRLAPEHRIDLAETPPNRWVETIADRLNTTTQRNTNFIGVGYESLDPECASAVVRAVIDAYLQFVEKSHRGDAGQILDVLTIERDALEAELAKKQAILHSSRTQIGHLGLSESATAVDPIIARAIKANEALMEAQQRRVELQSSLATVQAAIAGGEDLRQHFALVQASVGERLMLSSLGLAENDMVVLAEQQARMNELRGELERLQPFLGDKHPKIAGIRGELVAAERSLASYHTDARGRDGSMSNHDLAPLLTSMIQQGLTAAVERERQTEQTFQVARTEAARQSGDFLKLEMLERDVERLEKWHDLLFEKIAAVDIRQVQAPVRATIVEEPLPPENPCSPRLRYIGILSLCSGLSIGLALAYAQDAIDDRFGSPEEMASQLGARVLAVVRQLRPLSGKGLDALAMHVCPSASECEAFRTLRASIALGGATSDRLVLSSSEPGDGKTTVAANLAVSYAMSGKRTLLIDADLRKPGLTALLALKGRPGLTDVLSAESSFDSHLERSVVTTEIERLHVMPSGPRRPDPSELLLGKNLTDLLAWAERHYDQVLLDCPPVLAVSDAQIVARLADGVVLVVTPEKNHRRLVSRACEAFRQSGTPLIGLVANRVSESAAAGYGYEYGYGHDDTPRLNAA